MTRYRKFLQKSVVSFVHIVSETMQRQSDDPLILELNKRAINSSADYVLTHLKTAIIFPNKKDLYKFSFTLPHRTGSYLELGVFEGESLNYIAKLASGKSRTIHGFDSFQGLAEDWKGSIGFVKGHFSLAGQLPVVEDNVVLHVGLFSDTLPRFKREHQESLAFLHIDCDTYESTSQALKILGSQINSGTLVILDEYVGFPGWQFGEYLAWKEFINDSGLNYEYVGFSNQTALVRIL